MKILQVTAASANFANGVLKLSTEQARSRAHALEDLGDGYFEILSPVTFKRGEIVGFDGDVNKALLQDVDSEEDGGKALEDMDRDELIAIAREKGLSFHPNTGAPKLIELIRGAEEGGE